MTVVSCFGVTALLCTVVACSTPRNCTADLRDGLLIVVTDPSGNRICDAVITIRDGTYVETNPGSPDNSASCAYGGAAERVGTYEIDVSHPGYFPGTQKNITVVSDGCHVVPQNVNIELTPNRADAGVNDAASPTDE